MKKVAAIGTFDGVHRGHRSVLDTLVDVGLRNNLLPVAITFSNHPLSLIDPSRLPRTLTPTGKKVKLLEQAGVKPLVLEFDEELRSKKADEWLGILHDKFDVETLVIGYDSTFGSDGVNLSMNDYRQLAEKNGINLVVAPELKNVSSSAIRKAVGNGEMEKAAEMLGRTYSLRGKVEKGNSLGHTIGFPTANVKPDPDIAIPASGVYAARVKAPDGKVYPAMVNIGTRPTVKRGNDIVIEAHLIGWEGDLYGKQISIRFVKRLRDEKQFGSIEELKEQLRHDKEEVTDLLGK
ncbi:MAG: riboflavin biosynthesis protein RibF [Muribaculaceae bacterium]|nr:riboflavin biosynthesis protein RibF [Muribaculaceae bacterium]